MGITDLTPETCLFPPMLPFHIWSF